jgi:hypothetical protein
MVQMVGVSAVPRWSHRDPVESGNPFPRATREHQAWETATAEALRQLGRCDARLAVTAQVSLDPDVYRAQLLDLAVERFDTWAHRGLAVVWSDDDGRAYTRWLEEYVRNWLRYVAETCPRVIVGDELGSRLSGRATDWSAQARRALSATASDPRP